MKIKYSNKFLVCLLGHQHVDFLEFAVFVLSRTQFNFNISHISEHLQAP